MSDKEFAHRMTFEAIEDQNPDAVAASRSRGGEVARDQRHTVPEPEWLYYDYETFVQYLESIEK